VTLHRPLVVDGWRAFAVKSTGRGHVVCNETEQDNNKND